MKFNFISNIIKQVFQKIITSNLVFSLIVRSKIKDDFILNNGSLISVKNRTQFVISLIYFEFYERKELKIIKKYLYSNFPIIELGASLGVTTSLICKIINSKVIAVEANPNLKHNLELTKEKNNFNNLHILSAAISYTNNDVVNFNIDENNLGSKISSKGILVPSITLESIVLKNNIREFILISDIEGAELSMFLNETNRIVIDNCKQIIIELHDSEFNGISYSKLEIAKIIEDKFQMKVLFNYGDIWVFNK